MAELSEVLAQLAATERWVDYAVVKLRFSPEFGLEPGPVSELLTWAVARMAAGKDQARPAGFSDDAADVALAAVHLDPDEFSATKLNPNSVGVRINRLKTSFDIGSAGQ